MHMHCARVDVCAHCITVCTVGCDLCDPCDKTLAALQGRINPRNEIANTDMDMDMEMSMRIG